MSRIRVGVLFGGRSAEHEVSILSARNVVAALDRTRFEPVLIGIDKSGRWLLQQEAALLASARDPRLVKINQTATAVTLEPRPSGGALVMTDGPARVDVVFPVLHGTFGEDGTVQGLLELADLPYVGAGVLGSAVGMDKDVMKRLLQHAGVPVMPFRTIRKADFARDPDAACAHAAEVGFPLFSKPANAGSSVGVRRVADASALPAALAHALEFDTKALAEAAAVGAREIECSVLGNDEPTASAPGEVIVRHPDGFYSYDAKYVDEGGASTEIPANLDEATTRAVRELAVRAFRALECAGLARVDFFLLDGGRLVVNEINTLPGFTAISMYPKMWEASGIGPTELVSRLVDLAIERHAARRALKVSYDFKK
ncbi:MAG: D-alanine--D-alanine ligase [Myxococcota bacterium]